MSFPESFWRGEPISGTNDSGPYDVRAIFTPTQIILRSYNYIGENQFAKDVEIYQVSVINGNFNYANGRFVNGTVFSEYASYTDSGHYFYNDQVNGGPYPQRSITIRRFNGVTVDPQSFYDIGSGSETRYEQYNSGGGQQTRKDGTFFLGDLLTESQFISALSSEGVPEQFLDPFLGYKSDPLLKFNFKSVLPASNTVASPNNQINQTTPLVDLLTGTSRRKDVFAFVEEPGLGDQADKIVGFSKKDKDLVQISKTKFGIASGTFAIAKKPSKLDKLLATNVDIVYNKKLGQLILNANGLEPGFGDDGGVFAILQGSPKLTGSSVSFV